MLEALLATSLQLNDERAVGDVQGVPHLMRVLWGFPVIRKTTIRDVDVHEVSILGPEVDLAAVVSETGATQAVIPLAGPISPATSVDKEISECVVMVWQVGAGAWCKREVVHTAAIVFEQQFAPNVRRVHRVGEILLRLKSSKMWD